MDITPNTGAENSTEQSGDFLAGESLEAVESALVGDNPHTFRVAESRLDTHEHYHPTVRVNTPSIRTVEEIAQLEPTFNQHQAVTGRPFTASYFKLDKSYPALTKEEKAPFEAVESYLASRIASGNFKDSAETAAQLIQELEAKINLKDYHDPYYKAEKLSNYLANLGKYEKQKTVKARVTKEVLNQHKAQTRTIKEVEKKVDLMNEALDRQESQSKTLKAVAKKVELMSDLPSTVEKKIDKITNEARRIAREAPTKSQLDDLSLQIDEVGKQIPSVTAKISEQIGELISFNQRAFQEISNFSEKTEQALSIAEKQTKKNIDTKEAISKILQAL